MSGEIYLLSREYKMCQNVFNRFPSFLSIRYASADVDAFVIVVRRMCSRKDEINLDMEFS
jgi:urate oxidase